MGINKAWLGDKTVCRWCGEDVTDNPPDDAFLCETCRTLRAELYDLNERQLKLYNVVLERMHKGSVIERN